MTPQDPDEFEVPEGYGEDIGNPLDTEGVRLPFMAPYTWWQNGKNVFKKDGGAPYFGGWAMSDVDMASVAAANNDVLPLQWTSYDLVNDKGDDYTAFMTRWAYIAVLGTRKRWLQEENKGQYQVLAYAAYQGQNKEIIPFSPVVLTCKGTAGMFLQAAVIKFATQTAAARKKFAHDLPISAFFATIGTFGTTPEAQSVGKEEGKKKMVTPLKLWLPEKIDGSYLHAAFVGKDLAALTASLRKDAKDWLAAWKVAAPVKAKEVQEEPEYVPDPIEDHVPPEETMPY
jgi:hypothetical protein